MIEQNVKSSMIKKVAYDDANKILTVTFTNGAMYKYDEVPSNIATRLIDADSVGSYFSENIRGKFLAEKVD